ncbi:MAG: alpha/beta fold hydrolase [Parafilimonas terrae]|nr:alpha/beta fold hydrolase [Parafilimonas terrae]
MFLRCGDVDLHVRINGPRNAPAVVMLHALGTNLHLWDGAAELLAAEFRTVQVDLRGHGLSTVPPAPYAIDDLAADIGLLVEQLQLDAVHVVGISLGGAVALCLARRRPAYLRSLVLFDTDLSFPPASLWQERARLVRAEGLTSLVEPSIARWVSAAAVDEPYAHGLRAMLRRTDPDGYAGAAEALAAFDGAAWARDLVLPTLVVVGEADPSTPVARAEALRDAITGAELRVLPDLAHLPPAEAPEACARTIEGFLRAFSESTSRRQGDVSMVATEAGATHDARGARIDAAGREQCERLLHEWMAALNRHDMHGMNACLRFPHVRLAAGKITVLDEPDDGAWALFRRLKEQDGWDHSAWTAIELVQSSPSKAHFAVQYTRYRGDGTVIGVYDSLYVFTEAGGEWLLQARSSFGP